MIVNILKRLLSLDRAQKRILTIITDVVIIAFSLFMAMALRLDSWSFVNSPNIWIMLLIAVLTTLFILGQLGIYRAITRYMSSLSIGVLMLSAVTSGIIISVVNFGIGPLIPRSVPIIYSVVLFCILSGSRFFARSVITFLLQEPRTGVVVWGAGNAGRQLLGWLRNSTEYEVLGLVDDDTKLHGQVVDRVLINPPSKLGELKKTSGLKLVLLAAPSASVSERRKIIALVKNHALKIQTVPSINEILSGKALLTDLKNVQIEDLLARETVKPLEGLTSRIVQNKTVLVTGAGGSIGSELCKQIVTLKPKCIVLYEISEYGLYRINEEIEDLIERQNLKVKISAFLGSVQNADRIQHVISESCVDTIFHAAAYKHVPIVEQNLVEGIQNNVFGTKVLLEAAIDAEVENFTLISTDKAVRPTNFMGASKRLAELFCQAHATNQNKTRISIVRFGNVLWSSGLSFQNLKNR